MNDDIKFLYSTTHQMPSRGALTWVEVRWRYDWIAYRTNERGKKFSRDNKIPIADNELCKYGKIYKVKQIGDYDFRIISERPDLLPEKK